MQIGNEPRLTITLTEKGERARMMIVPKEAEMLLRVYLAHEELKAVDRNIEPRPGHRDRVLFVSACAARRCRRTSTWVRSGASHARPCTT
jgi:integrase/recombinase XerD